MTVPSAIACIPYKTWPEDAGADAGAPPPPPLSPVFPHLHPDPTFNCFQFPGDPGQVATGNRP